VISRENNESAAPVLNGLVLADKGLLNWHGKEQRYYLADLLQPFCQEVFISCREEQVKEMDAHYPTLSDIFKDMGPFGAIMSALYLHPDKAWLVVACDLPLMNEATLEYLIQHRDSSLMATTFESPFDGSPEPLITIWEPQSLPVLRSFKEQGYKCPRKVLMKNDIKILKPPYPDALINANTPEDRERVKEILVGRTVQSSEFKVGSR
jgi:molybdopterin-guanine dinucleotide biosynthesis protein A